MTKEKEIQSGKSLELEKLKSEIADRMRILRLYSLPISTSSIRTSTKGGLLDLTDEEISLLCTLLDTSTAISTRGLTESKVSRWKSFQRGTMPMTQRILSGLSMFLRRFLRGSDNG